MAVDDLLDALDGSPETWEADDFNLFMNRVRLNEHAIRQCIASVPQPTPFRLATLHASVTKLVDDLESMAHPVGLRTIERLEPIERFRKWWTSWGPVARLPGIISSEPDFSSDHRPSLQDSAIDLRWRTI
jgi:hypothetical protein